MYDLDVPSSLLTGGVVLNENNEPTFEVCLRQEIIEWCSKNLNSSVNLVEHHKKKLMKVEKFSLQFEDLSDCILFKMRWF